MMRALIITALLAVAACTTKPELNPVPVVQFIETKVPVPVACEPKIGPEPAYMDAPEALAAAPDVFERVKLLLAGRAQRIAREDVLTAALDQCRRPPSVPPRPG